MMNKKIFMFILSACFLLAVIGTVDASLCKGFNGYYHDCNYIYGHSSYNSYNGHSNYKLNYKHQNHYKDNHQKIIYLNNYKKYNSINNYHIHKGQSHSNIKIRYIKDERTYEPRYNVNPGGKQLKVYLIKNTNYIKLGHKNSIHHDGDPYHNIKNPAHFQTLHLKHEEHCPDGFICTSGKWY